jgi:hypothetical protein
MQRMPRLVQAETRDGLKQLMNELEVLKTLGQRPQDNPNLSRDWFMHYAVTSCNPN